MRIAETGAFRNRHRYDARKIEAPSQAITNERGRTVMTIRNCFIAFAVLSTCYMAAGCRDVPERRFDLKGKVVAIDREQRQVTIAHEQIKGFMDAMTMPFNVEEDWALSALAPGQIIEATLIVQGDRSWIEGIKISQREAADGLAPTGRCRISETKCLISASESRQARQFILPSSAANRFFSHSFIRAVRFRISAREPV